MNCQNVRSEIDTASRRAPMGEPVKAHLSGCQDCRRHADHTSALLALLGAQPRVEAPPDFDFKLRARIARAEAEPRSAWAALARFWTGSFSWGQAVTATATLALVATFTAVYFNSDGQPAGAGPETTVAVSSPQADAAPLAVQAPSLMAEASLPAAKPAAVKFSVRNSKASLASERPAVSEAQVAQVKMARSAPGNEATWQAYNLKKGQIVTAPVRANLIGAEHPASTLAKTAADVPSI
jgi:hypothetical protein